MNSGFKTNQERKAYSTSLRLTPELHARLERLAERTDRSKTFYIQEAIRLHLEELEKIYLTKQELIEQNKAVPKK